MFTIPLEQSAWWLTVILAVVLIAVWWWAIVKNLGQPDRRRKW